MDRILRRLNLEYRIDEEGDYRAEVPAGGNGKVSVGIGGRLRPGGSSMEVRDIWAVAARLPGTPPVDLAENLLRDNWSSRHFGAWAHAGTTSDGRHVLVYVVRIPADSSLKVYRTALEYTAEKASELQKALSDLEEGR
jgi:hypothetical protein